jgi:sec-independent protein translocase protein TatA
LFEGLLQPTHLIIILAICVIVFGPGKLGDVGRELGKGVRTFKKSMSEIDDVKESLKVDVNLKPDAVKKDAPRAG